MNAARWLSLIVILLAANPSPAQAERYEAGARMKAFEAAWETADAEGRKRSLAILPAATTQFLTLRVREAGRTLDRARHRLTADGEPTTLQQWRDCLGFTPEVRFVDGAAKELAITVQPFYDANGPRPKSLEIRFWFVNDDVVTVKPERFPLTVKVPLPPLGEFRGLDRRLFIATECGKERSLRSMTVSQVKDLRPRLTAIRKAVAAWNSFDTIEQATVHDRLELLTSLADGTHLETDLPGASLLANAEAMLDGKPFFTPEKPSEFWMSLPMGGKKTAPIRVFVPKGITAGKPVPVVVALHGAGGSENLFFEGYGAGRIVKECQDRGWFLVAPRLGINFLDSPPVPAMLAALEKRFPIDAKRTFLVGHSMGAAQVVELVQKHPGRFAAVAALGGGGGVRQAAAFLQLPTWIGVGDQDFARSAAKRTADALTAAGAKVVTFKEYPGIEHMVIVREALPDVFTHFDKVAK